MSEPGRNKNLDVSWISLLYIVHCWYIFLHSQYNIFLKYIVFVSMHSLITIYSSILSLVLSTSTLRTSLLIYTFILNIADHFLQVEVHMLGLHGVQGVLQLVPRWVLNKVHCRLSGAQGGHY